MSKEAIAARLHHLFAEKPGSESDADTAHLAVELRKMSAEHRQRLPELLELLQKEEEEVWATLCQTLIMDQVRSFATRLQTWDTEYHAPELRTYVSTLTEQIDRFDLAHLPDTIAKFPDVRTQLQRWVE